MLVCVGVLFITWMLVFVLCWFYVSLCFVIFFFFKQKTAYEMRISDWSSDVCSSDLLVGGDAVVRRGRDCLVRPTAGSSAILPEFRRDLGAVGNRRRVSRLIRRPLLHRRDRCGLRSRICRAAPAARRDWRLAGHAARRGGLATHAMGGDRKSTRLNSS